MDGGTTHGEVITRADHPDRYMPEVWGDWGFIPPDASTWGYCEFCEKTFRWSVPDQQWRPWPGGLAQLPLLTDEELEVLQSAIAGQAAAFDAALSSSQSETMKATLWHRWLTLQSLATATAETRYSLFPREGPHPARVWGEAWTVLEAWLDDHLAGPAVADDTTLLSVPQALRAVKAQIAALKAPPPNSVERRSSDPWQPQSSSGQ